MKSSTRSSTAPTPAMPYTRALPPNGSGYGWKDDARHAFVDLVAGRVGRRRQLRQPLLPRTRGQAFAARRRPVQPREAVGHLRRRAGGVEGAPGMACLAAPYRERVAARRPAPPSLGDTAPAEHDRHALRLLPAGLDPARRPPAPRHRGLRALDPRMTRLRQT